MKYTEMSREELLTQEQAVKIEYRRYVDKGLALDMSRGKPDTAQIDL